MEFLFFVVEIVDFGVVELAVIAVLKAAVVFEFVESVVAFADLTAELELVVA